MFDRNNCMTQWLIGIFVRFLSSKDDLLNCAEVGRRNRILTNYRFLSHSPCLSLFHHARLEVVHFLVGSAKSNKFFVIPCFDDSPLLKNIDTSSILDG